MKIIHKISLLFILSLCFSCKNEIEEQSPIFSNSDGSLYNLLTELSTIEDHSIRKQLSVELWESLIDTAKIPYTYQDTAIFLFKGKAEKVSYNGDFNAWGGDKSIQNNAKQIDSTDLWYLVKKIPTDARLDYKITLNENQWVLDPANPFQQWSGFGPNSELRMPEWEEEPINQVNDNSPSGTVDSFILKSINLNYSIAIKVFKPYNYTELENLPVLYITDGHEYIDSKLGNLNTITDNLISQEAIDPIVIVYLDPRNPGNLGENRREQEYTLNVNYLNFVKKELIPHIDSTYKTNQEKRAILGTSLGGLNATYFGLTEPTIFTHIGVQSPAYWYKPEIFNLATQSTSSHQKIFISAGTFYDGLDRAKRMEGVFMDNGVAPQFLQVNEGHSWGAWNHQLDNLLLYFFKVK